jgi:hypothetical protein
MEKPYIFKSDAVLVLLPDGAKTAAHVTRDEAIRYLGLVKKSAEKSGADYFGTLVFCRLQFKDSWDAEHISRQAECLIEDISVLQQLALASNTQSKGDE